MKRVFQYFKLAGISGLLCLFMAADANAQRGGGHASGGGGGGGGRPSGGGGGGGGFSRGGGNSGGGGGFSGGNSGGGFSRGGGNPGGSRQPSGGSFGGGRNSNGFSPNAVAPQSVPRGGEHGAPLSFRRGGVGTPNRGSYGYGNSNRGGFGNSRGGFNNAYRGGYGSIRGGFYRGGRYYPGGYGSRYYSPGYGYRYSPWHTSGGYYYNRGFYGSLYYPRLGFSLGVLPYGYYPFYWGASRFFYSDGYFYQYDNNQYTVVEPPLGAAVNGLPKNAQSIVINGQQYYEANGVYYTPVTRDDGTVVYQVAGKDGQLDQASSPENGYDIQNDGYRGRSNDSDPAAIALPSVGDLVYALPADSRKIKLNGELFYVSPDDIYFQETRDTNGNKAYKVTSIPEDN